MAPSKRGLGWPYDNGAAAFKPYEPSIRKNELTWLFNWEMYKPEGFPQALEYVPQVRTEKEASQIDQYLNTLGAANVKHFIGFNEPDNTGQANLPAAKAAQLWKQFVLPAKHKFNFRLGSPAITNSAAGKKWLQDFIHEMDGKAAMDFIVIHWYGLNVKDLESFVTDIHKTFGKPVWLNEFACTTFGGEKPTQQQVDQFAKEALKFLDGQEFVARYSWFGSATHDGSMGGVALVNELARNGNLTSVGKIYCGQSSEESSDLVSSLHINSKAAVAPAAAAATKPGIKLTNKSHKEDTYYFFNNYWNGDATAGANFDHPEQPTKLKAGESKFVELAESFKGRVQRGKAIPATWAEFQLSAANDHKAWGDISLEQGYDGPAMIRAMDGSGIANGFTKDILPGAPAAAKQKRQSDGKECIASTVGNWLGGKNQAAIDYEKKVVGQKKAYIVGGKGTDVVNSKDKRLAVEFY